MQVFTIAVDLKVPELGPLKVLEIMPGNIAGSAGYMYAYGRDMTSDRIKRSYREQFNQFQIFIGDRPELKDTRRNRHMLVYLKSHISGTRLDLQQADIDTAAKNPGDVLVNGNLAFLALGENKAAQAFLFQQDKTIAPHLPRTMVLPTLYEPSLADRIIQAFPDTTQWVIKPVDQSYGNGVTLACAENLDTTLKDILKNRRQFKTAAPGIDPWLSDIAPIFMVQEYTQSLACKFQGHVYDGTMRVFATLHRTHETSPFNVTMHGAYWKLPKEPLNAKRSFASTVSQSTGHWQYKQMQAKQNIFQGLIPPVKLHAAQVNDDVQARVYADLKIILPRMMARAVSQDLDTRIKSWLEKDCVAHEGAAMMMATRPAWRASAFYNDFEVSLNRPGRAANHAYLTALADQSAHTNLRRYMDERRIGAHKAAASKVHEWITAIRAHPAFPGNENLKP